MNRVIIAILLCAILIVLSILRLIFNKSTVSGRIIWILWIIFGLTATVLGAVSFARNW